MALSLSQTPLQLLDRIPVSLQVLDDSLHISAVYRGCRLGMLPQLELTILMVYQENSCSVQDSEIGMV